MTRKDRRYDVYLLALRQEMPGNRVTLRLGMDRTRYILLMGVLPQIQEDAIMNEDSVYATTYGITLLPQINKKLVTICRESNKVWTDMIIELIEREYSRIQDQHMREFIEWRNNRGQS